MPLPREAVRVVRIPGRPVGSQRRPLSHGLFWEQREPGNHPSVQRCPWHEGCSERVEQHHGLQRRRRTGDDGLIQSAARSATEIAVICDVMAANIDVEGFGRPTPFGWVCG